MNYYKKILFEDNIVILHSQLDLKSNNKFRSENNSVKVSNPVNSTLVSNYQTTPKITNLIKIVAIILLHVYLLYKKYNIYVRMHTCIVE